MELLVVKFAFLKTANRKSHKILKIRYFVALFVYLCSIVSDYLGTPCQAYTETGAKVWEYEQKSYGGVESLQGAINFIPFRFQGQYEDVETGLYYNRFRYYSPEEGSYISQDPIGLASGEFNLYNYVGDTNTLVDSLGLHIASAVYTNNNGISGEVGTFNSSGGIHTEPKILGQMGNQQGGHLEITSLGPKGDGSTSFFRNPNGKSFPAGPLQPCTARSQNCDMLLHNQAKTNNMTITYKWGDNVRTYHPDGKVTQNGQDISHKYHH